MLINLIFTNCASACPLLTRGLSSVADPLEDDMGETVRFVAIGIDRERHCTKIAPIQLPPAIAERMREFMDAGFSAVGG